MAVPSIALAFGSCPMRSYSHGALVSRAQTVPSKPAPAPTLQLIDLSSYQQVLAKYRGKPTLVTFWATWCEPCRDEYPTIIKLAAQYAPEGLAVFGVNMDDDADLHLVGRFMALHHPGFANIRQKPGIDLDSFYQGVNPEWHGTMPETIFYGRDGHIALSFVGEKSRDDFERCHSSLILAEARRSSLPRCPAADRCRGCQSGN